jgi:uncharacterized damage-inducible protein DinB
METLTTTRFEIIPALLKELEQEAATTRKMLSRIPEDKYDWQPHPRSMKMGELAVHLADIPGWIDMALNTEVWDMAVTPYVPAKVSGNDELLQLLEQSCEKGRTALEEAKSEDLLGSWEMRNGDQVYAKLTKYETIRHSFSQTAHHRAQLGVYLRLLNIPIPGSYGPSADEHS